MPPKRDRAVAVDLEDHEVDKLLSEHVRLKDCSVAKLFAYDALDRKHAPAWKDLHQHRHMMTDVVLLTRGRL